MDLNLNNLLPKVTVSLSAYLENVLPMLYADWWKQAVVKNLSFQQQRRIEQSGICSLDSLDLAALLRVFDQNWYEISNKSNLTSELRHFVKEMQTVRNRWAHSTTEGVLLDDVYRDLDTMQRFAGVIGADDALIQEIKTSKTGLLAQETRSSGKINRNNVALSEASVTQVFEFEPGQVVCVKSNPTIRGAVISVLPSKPENRFKVFVDGGPQTFYASQLQVEIIQDDVAECLPCEQFHAYLTALQIRYPGLSTLYSLNAARIDFIPYQFRPVLRFIRSDRPRMLIADGVGVGKTIEAGLMLRELQARRDIQSILIICPRPLITERKWQKEMKRFDENFTHLDGGALRFCINETDLNGEWPDQYRKIIVPYSLFDEALLYGTGKESRRKRKNGLLDLDPPPRFDLVIVDEAHHIRNQDTFSHKAVSFFCDHAEAVIFLTATPIQLGSYDLYVLLNTLRPDLILDQASYEHMAEPNPFINQTISVVRSQGPEWTTHASEALEQAASTPWGQAILRHNPEFSRIQSILAQGDISPEARIQLVNDLESLHTFSGIINRTRRRDIGDFTVRKPETVVVEFTPDQKQLHDELLAIQAEILSRIHGNINIKFMMTTIRRQAASCLYGLVPFLEEILKRHFDELSWAEADDTEEIPQVFLSDDVESRIHTILNKARNLDPNDPKLEALRKIIQNKHNLPNNKVMLFSSFRHTLNYLYKHLKADGFRVGIMHGGTPDEERSELRNRFELSSEQEDALDVMLFSEIGCEGLDYQFCDCMVNYDLPWNPMRIEQRIGRIDRNGQKSESVAIFNLITPGTVDADIYERCLFRIGVFNYAIGDNEEILGEITKEIRDISESFNLNEKDRREKLQQLADNKIRLIQEQEQLEQRQLELFGIRLPQDQMKKEIDNATSFWLSSESICRLANLYLSQIGGKDQEYILGEKPLKTLRLSQDARNKMFADFQKLPKISTSNYRDWEKWLKGGSQYLPITFESECALQNQDASFIMPLHPLVKQAAMSLDTKKRVVTAIKVISDEVPAGKYEFAIYQWQYHGIREDLVLIPVASSEKVTALLPKSLEKAEDLMSTELLTLNMPVWNDLDSQHYKLWTEARTMHCQRMKELAAFRRESLATSHRARIALLEEQLGQASDEKIRKMRQSQIAAAEADYARRIQELEIAMERADITAEPIAYGVIEIMGGESHEK